MKSEGRGQEIIKSLPYLRPCVSPSVCLFVTFVHKPFKTSTFMKISSPNLKGMFMAIKTCLCNILASF